ncbi:hypothetical protein FNV43_RR13400 [Rhamnella rubrinervis]|uniref:Uncharacterized protein n=1 Tax=Rhamnella rubrinervis TaxID=2594499 RepID=A0A8K0H134_9ROSA|nr:hypothetical protein FNV43_RR13400 [Rhamnella rubrinervis]
MTMRKMSGKPKDVEEYKKIQKFWIGCRRETLLALLRDESLAFPSHSSDDSSSDFFTEEDPEKDLEEDPEEDHEEESESVDEEIEILEYKPEMEGDGKQKDNSVIEDSPESRKFFRRFGNKKRKRNVIRSRSFRPRTCKQKREISYVTEVIPKPIGLGIDESEVEFVPRRLRTELRRLA